MTIATTPGNNTLARSCGSVWDSLLEQFNTASDLWHVIDLAMWGGVSPFQPEKSIKQLAFVKNSQQY